MTIYHEKLEIIMTAILKAGMPFYTPKTISEWVNQIPNKKAERIYRNIVQIIKMGE